MKKSLITFTLLALLISPLSAGELEDALEAYKNQDYVTAHKKFLLLGEQGDVDAQYKLGYMYSEGKGVEENEEEADKWYKLVFKNYLLLAEKGDAEARYELGYMYDYGIGIKKNDKEAVKWYKLAAKQGYVYAQYELGRMYSGGYGVEENDKEAVKWYTLAAKQDHVYAQIKLGDMYSGGYYEIEENKEEAIKWYKLAIEQGNADAQNSLAIMYKREGDKYSHGAEENKEAADKWYRLAFENYLPLAQKGDANAQDILGSMYYKGLGVKQNEKEAMKWYAQALRSYTLAVNQKDGDSFLFKLAFLYYQLARIYYSRDGDIEKDLVRALMWTSLSAEIAPSAPMLGYYNEARIEYFYEKLLEELSPKQIKEAEQLIKSCRESNFERC